MPAKAGIQYAVKSWLITSASEYWIIRFRLLRMMTAKRVNRE
jgi:hypothetical protein